MKDFFHEAQTIINKELLLINQKIKSTTFLEILKFKLIDKLKEIFLKNNLVIDEDIQHENFFEDDYKKISTKFIICKSPKIHLKNIITQDLLIISLKDVIKIDVEEDLKKTYSSFNLLPFTGITLPKDTICNLYFLKNSISLELNLDNKLKDIEKLEEKTI